MSRIGKLPIAIPSGVTVTLSGQNATIKGSLGELKHVIHAKVKVTQEGTTLVVAPVDDTREAKALWGTTRTVLANMTEGVSKGFEKNLTIKGVGYKVAQKGKDLELALGFSHPVPFKSPAGIELTADPKANTIKIRGIDKQLVGEAAANIRSFRPPEPYKGKGIAYVGEHIVRKAGKTAGK